MIPIIITVFDSTNKFQKIYGLQYSMQLMNLLLFDKKQKQINEDSYNKIEDIQHLVDYLYDTDQLDSLISIEMNIKVDDFYNPFQIIFACIYLIHNTTHVFKFEKVSISLLYYIRQYESLSLYQNKIFAQLMIPTTQNVLDQYPNIYAPRIKASYMLQLSQNAYSFLDQYGQELYSIFL